MTPEQQREWESDEAQPSTFPDLLRKRTAALDRVAAENERLRAIVQAVEGLAALRDVKYPERFAFEAAENHVRGYRAAQRDLRAVLAQSHAPQAPAEQEGDDLPDEACGSDGGLGIGAGHRCRCNRKAGHALDSDRPHGCSCGAMWSCADCASADMAGCAQCGAMPEFPAPSVRPATADDEGVRRG